MRRWFNGLKSLLYRSENTVWISRSHVKIPGVATHVCIFSAVCDVNAGDRMGPTGYQSSSTVRERPLLTGMMCGVTKQNTNAWGPTLASMEMDRRVPANTGVHIPHICNMHTYRHTHVCVCMCVCALHFPSDEFLVPIFCHISVPFQVPGQLMFLLRVAKGQASSLKSLPLPETSDKSQEPLENH